MPQDSIQVSAAQEPAWPVPPENPASLRQRFLDNITQAARSISTSRNNNSRAPLWRQRANPRIPQESPIINVNTNPEEEALARSPSQVNVEIPPQTPRPEDATTSPTTHHPFPDLASFFNRTASTINSTDLHASNQACIRSSIPMDFSPVIAGSITLRHFIT